MAPANCRGRLSIMEKTRAIGYIRQSTQKQKSLEWQQQALEEESDRRNHQMSRIFYDKGSGKSMDRPGIRMLKDSIRAGNIDFLYVWRLDRVSRKVTDLLSLYDFCVQYDVAIISIADPLGDSNDAMTKFQLSVIGSVAELYRELIAENQHIAYRQKHQMGLPLTAKVPFGYRYVNATNVTIDSEEASIVKRIYKLYLSGIGYKKMCTIFTEEGLLFRGNPFKTHNIRGVLTNKFYTGYIENEFGLVKGKHPAMISEELQKKVSENQRAKHVIQKDYRRNILRRKIRCPYCGKILSLHIVYPHKPSRNYKKIYYYTCSSYTANGKIACEGFHLNAEQIEGEVTIAMGKFLQNGQLLGKIQNNIQQKLSIKKNKADEDIAGIKKRKQDALIMFEKGRLSTQQLTEELTRLNRYVKIDEGSPSNGLMPDAVQRRELGSRIAILGKVQKMPTVQQYQFFQEIIDHIEVNENKEILGIYLKGWDQNILDVEDKE